MDYSTPIKTWCGCPDCTRMRQWNEQADRPRSYADLYETLSKAATVPFEPEQPPAPAYKFVLLDYEDGGAQDWCAELHTSESLIDALILRKDQTNRYRVFELGDCFLDVSE